MYTFVYIFVNMYIYINVYMYICICIYIHVYMYICIYVNMYACMYVRMYVCMYVGMYVCIVYIKNEYQLYCMQHGDWFQNKHQCYMTAFDFPPCCSWVRQCTYSAPPCLDRSHGSQISINCRFEPGAKRPYVWQTNCEFSIIHVCTGSFTYIYM